VENFDPDDPVTTYLREVENVQPLTLEEEKELFRNLGESGRSDERRENVARRIIETHLQLVARTAERHASTGIPKLDWIQEGNIALMQPYRALPNVPSAHLLTTQPLSLNVRLGNWRKIANKPHEIGNIFIAGNFLTTPQVTGTEYC
jgi:hypothetical protein